MTKDKEYNILYFNDDDEFYTFCVKPQILLTSIVDDEGVSHECTTFDFTDEYKTAVNNGTSFVIKDENSLITKHNAVSLGFHTKEVKNLEPYNAFYDKYINRLNGNQE